MEYGREKFLMPSHQVVRGKVEDCDGGGGDREDMLEFLKVPSLESVERCVASLLVLVPRKSDQDLNIFFWRHG